MSEKISPDLMNYLKEYYLHKSIFDKFGRKKYTKFHLNNPIKKVSKDIIKNAHQLILNSKLSDEENTLCKLSLNEYLMENKDKL